MLRSAHVHYAKKKLSSALNFAQKQLDIVYAAVTVNS